MADALPKIAASLRELSLTDGTRLPIVTAFAPMLITLMNGPADEVNFNVRRRAFTAMASIIQPSEYSSVDDDGIMQISDTVLEGMVDSDRSVRLSAGYETK